MGDIGKILGMSSAAGGVPDNGTPPDANSNMSAAVMGFPSINLGPSYGNDLPSQGGITGRMPQGDDVTITGDAWKPKDRTFLGKLGDALSLVGGGGTPFKDKRDGENMRDAISNFASDPLTAIRHMARIPGHEKEALALYEHYTDNQRQQGNLDRQNEIFDMKKGELVNDRIASMMGAANPGSWSKMRDLAQTYADKYHVDITGLIPKDYDADSIEYIRQGAIKPKDQERIAQSDRRLDQGDTRIAETGRHHVATEGQAATNETGRQSRHDNPVARPGAAGRPEKWSEARPVTTKNGILVPSKKPGVYGLKRDGKIYAYAKINDKYVPLGEVKE